jgi:hypothetical protein
MTEESTVPLTLPPPIDGGSPAASPVDTIPAPTPPSAPYRSPVQEATPSPAPLPREWPVLGLSLWVFGVAMWAFVVMGQLATSYGPGKQGFLLGEGTAGLFVFGATVGAWGVGLRQSLASTPAQSTSRAVGRALGVAAIAFLLWGLVTIFAAAFGESTHVNLDGKITVTLALVAGGAAFAGRRMAGLHRQHRTPRDRTVGRVLWIGAALLSIVALAEVIASD